jgi:hypothetical protein
MVVETWKKHRAVSPTLRFEASGRSIAFFKVVLFLLYLFSIDIPHVQQRRSKMLMS